MHKQAELRVEMPEVPCETIKKVHEIEEMV